MVKMLLILLVTVLCPQPNYASSSFAPVPRAIHFRYALINRSIPPSMTASTFPVSAIYVRENSWDDAYELWRQAFEGTKNQKKKMRAALNIAVYYEMKDSLAKAEEWAEKAQQLAKKIDKKNITDSPQATIDDVPNYYLTTLYLAELKERNAQLPKLKLQMSRFNDDF